MLPSILKRCAFGPVEKEHFPFPRWMKFVTTSEQDKENLGKFISNQASGKELTFTWNEKKKRKKKGDLKSPMALLIQCLAPMKCSRMKLLISPPHPKIRSHKKKNAGIYLKFSLVEHLIITLTYDSIWSKMILAINISHIKPFGLFRHENTWFGLVKQHIRDGKFSLDTHMIQATYVTGDEERTVTSEKCGFYYYWDWNSTSWLTVFTPTLEVKSISEA